MTHRPYPSSTRARHQLDRHDDETPPLSEPRPMTPFGQRLTGQMAAIMKAAQPDGVTLADRLRAAFQPRPAGSEEASG